jgi:type IV secretion system protein VirD4
MSKLLSRHLIFFAISLIITVIVNQFMLQYMFSYFYGQWIEGIIYPLTAIKTTFEFWDNPKYGDTGENVLIATSLSMFLCYMLCLMIARMFGKKFSDRHGSARFLKMKEIISMGFLNSTDKIIKDRPCLIVGDIEHHSGVRVKRKSNPWGERNLKLKHLTHYGEQSVILIAPPGGGKGVGIVKPNLFNYRGSLVVNDNKGVEYQSTAGWRSTELGNLCLKYEPASNDGSSISINPLDYIELGTPEEFTQAMKIAEMFTNDKAKDPHFQINGVTLLAAVILHVMYTRSNNSMSDVLTMLSSVDPDTEAPFDTYKEWMAEMCGAEYQPKGKSTEEFEARQKFRINHLQGFMRKKSIQEDEARQILGDMIDVNGYIKSIRNIGAGLFANDGEKEVSGIISSSKGELIKLFNNPLIIKHTKTSTIKFSEFQRGDKPITLYLVSNNVEKMVAPLFRAIFELIFDEIKKNKHGIKRELTFLLDEYPQLGLMDAIPSKMLVLREFKVRFVIVSQSFNALEEIYGKQGTEKLVSACGVQIYYPNNSSAENERISAEIGKTTRMEKDENTSVQQQGLWGGVNVSKSKSTHYNQRQLMTADEVRTMGDRIIVMFEKKNPILGRAYNIYEIKEDTAKLDLPIPDVQYIETQPIV